MKATLLLCLILASIAFLASCENAQEKTICDEPYIVAGTGCCLDQDSNKICDEQDKETIENQPAAEIVNNNNTEEPGNSPEQVIISEPGANNTENPSETKDALDNFSIEDPGLVGDYLKIFKGKQTQIIFGYDSGAPLVAATINLLAYYGNPDSMKYSAILDTASMDEFPSANVILLGNGCNNNYIRELLALDKDDCFGPLDDDTGVLKILKVNDKYVLFIMAKEDADVHGIVSSLVKGEIEISGNEVEVDLT